MSPDSVQKPADGELDDEQLESVAGGFGTITTPPNVLNKPNDYKCPTCGAPTNGVVAHMCTATPNSWGNVGE